MLLENAISYLMLWVVDNVDGVSFAYNQDFEEHGTKTDVKSSSFINKVNANIWAINSQINNGYPYLKNLYW